MLTQSSSTNNENDKFSSYLLKYVALFNDDELMLEFHDKIQQFKQEQSQDTQNYINLLKNNMEEKQIEINKNKNNTHLQDDLNLLKHALEQQLYTKDKYKDTIFVPTKILEKQDIDTLDPSISYLECEHTMIDTRENFENTVKHIHNVTEYINGEIKKLKNNDRKKIYIEINSSHATGIVIGKRDDGQSYLFIDRHNSQKNYLGNTSMEQLQQQDWFKNSNINTKEGYNFENNYFYEHLNADVIIPTTEIQSDAHNCFLYSYIYCQIFSSNNEEINKLINAAFENKNKNKTKIYDFQDCKKMPLPLQLLYQREIDTTIHKRVNENIHKAIKEINKKISSKMDGTKFRSNYVVDRDEVNDIPNNYNEMLSFLGIMANIDIEEFKSFVDEMMAIYNNQEKTDRVDLTNQKTDGNFENSNKEKNTRENANNLNLPVITEEKEEDIQLKQEINNKDAGLQLKFENGNELGNNTQKKLLSSMF